MAFPAPSPSTFGIRLAEDGDEIVFGVTLIGAFAFFDNREEVFAGHDRFGLHVSALAEGDGKQGLREMALAGIHFLERQTLAHGRNEDPVGSFFVFKSEGGFGALSVIKRTEEGIGGLG